MIGENEWFMEYKMLSNDEREVYRDFILDTEEKAVAYDYERFIKAIELTASHPGDLQEIYSEKLNVAEEVALTFDNECIFIASNFKNQKFISEKIYDLVMQIDKQLKLLSNEHNEDNWTLQAMENDRRWIKARELAVQVLAIMT